MYKLFFFLFQFIILEILFCQDIKPMIDNWKIFENSPAPSISVSTEKSAYLPGEAILVRVILKNEHSVKIPIHEKALKDSSLSVGIGLFAQKISKGYTEQHYSLSRCGTDCGGYGNPVYLDPGESIMGDFIVGSAAYESGKYYIRTSYYWRECSSKTKSTEIGRCQFIYPDPVEISILEPKEENEAFRYPINSTLLTMLQSPLYGCTVACSGVKDVYCEDTPDFYVAQARKFLERFPKSAYARYMTYTLGMILKDQKNFRASEEQMGKFIVLYPDDWMVDDAMFEMAECQLEQGNPDKAQATLESLLQKFPLTSAHKAKRVLENLKKGYRTIDQVYSH